MVVSVQHSSIVKTLPQAQQLEPLNALHDRFLIATKPVIRSFIALMLSQIYKGARAVYLNKAIIPLHLLDSHSFSFFD